MQSTLRQTQIYILIDWFRTLQIYYQIEGGSQFGLGAKFNIFIYYSCTPKLKETHTNVLLDSQFILTQKKETNALILTL